MDHVGDVLVSNDDIARDVDIFSRVFSHYPERNRRMSCIVVEAILSVSDQVIGDFEVGSIEYSHSVIVSLVDEVS